MTWEAFKVFAQDYPAIVIAAAIILHALITEGPNVTLKTRKEN